MTDKRKYVKQSFQMYLNNKRRLEALNIPGLGGVDYSRAAIGHSEANGVETQVVKYLDEKNALEKRVELVKRTIEHFKVECAAKGKGHYKYICARWLRRMSYRRAAIECEIPERTAGFWIEEIYTIAEAIAETYNLF